MGRTYWIKQEIRNAVSKFSKGLCYHCGKLASKADISKRGVLTFYDSTGRTFHLDHLTPVAEGGSHTRDNLVLSCGPCNQSKRRRVAANDPEIIEIMNVINKESV